MSKVNRKRDKVVSVRMSKVEADDLDRRVKESGLSKQSYILSSIKGATITPSNEIEILKDISMTFSDFERQLRGLATNVNQMAHVANGQGVIPSEEELNRLSIQLNNYRKESEDLWQLIRSSINQQNHTEP